MTERKNKKEETAMSANPQGDRLAKDPILIDLGRKSRKNINRVRDGEGKLMVEIQDTIDELRTNGTMSESAQPVIIIVREKRSSRAINRLWPLA